jgi:hypothetical protein
VWHHVTGAPDFSRHGSRHLQVRKCPRTRYYVADVSRLRSSLNCQCREVQELLHNVRIRLSDNDVIISQKNDLRSRELRTFQHQRTYWLIAWNVTLSLHICFSGSAAQRGLWPPRTTRFRDYTQRRATVGRTPLDKWSARRRDLYLTTHKLPCPLWDSNSRSQ